jgi:HSF-type DNA-binding
MNEESGLNDSLSGAPSSTFPQKLFAMSLQEFDEGEVIHWLPHGLAFKVVDSDKFAEEVIPKYFKRKLSNLRLPFKFFTLANTILNPYDPTHLFLCRYETHKLSETVKSVRIS